MTTPVALAHDNLAARAGGERVLSVLADIWPDAPIHTLIHEPDATFAPFAHGDVRPSVVNRVPPLRRRYRATVPIAALDWSRRRIDAEVTICSTSGLSHHARTSGRKLVYCHTPARWIHAPELYMRGYPAPVRATAAALRPGLRRLDQRAMGGADLVVANSHAVADEIVRIYGRSAAVVAPCSSLDLDGPVEALASVEPGFVLVPVRPLGYKRFDVWLEAARRRPDLRFVHLGGGPHRAALFADAPDNIRSFGSVSEASLRWAYRNARAALTTCAEDFGLVPLEAAAHGLPMIAPRSADSCSVIL